MPASLARLITELAEQQPATERFLELIKENTDPERKLSPTDIHIRAMYIVSDQVNSYGGRFDAADQARLAELLIDSPVLVGHRKDKLPIARTFHAETVERNNARWVRSYFYWLKDTTGADDLAANIDAGIYRECSIAFTYWLPECSICGQDVRTCDHEPGREYDNEVCHYIYRNIERVLETSLVYRGATPDTRVTGELTEIQSPEELPESDTYLVVPRYDGIPVRLHPSENGRPIVCQLDGSPVAHPDVTAAVNNLPPAPHIDRAVLVGYRGKQRCTSSELRDYLDGDNSRVARAVVTVWPTGKHSDIDESRHVRTLPHRRVSRSDVLRAAREIMTRDGVEVWPENSNTGYHLQPDKPQQPTATLALNDGSVIISHPSLNRSLQLQNYDAVRFEKGHWFAAIVSQSAVGGETVERLPISRIESEDTGHRIIDPDGQTYILRKVTLNGEDQTVVYRSSTAPNAAPASA